MTDPRRLIDLEVHDATGAHSRDLLRSLRPSGEAQAAVWKRLARQGVLAAGLTAATATTAAKAAAASGTAAVGFGAESAGAVAGAQMTVTAAATAASGTTTAAVSVSSALALKASLVLLVVAPVVGGTLFLTRSTPSPQSSEVAQAVDTKPVVHAQAQQQLATEPQAEPEVAVTLPPEPSPSGASAARVRPSADALKEENRLLREARALDHTGQHQQALRVLADLDTRFARGALLQEREILRVQALLASGAEATARARAKKFLERYPSSPYAAHAQAVLGKGAPAGTAQ